MSDIAWCPPNVNCPCYTHLTTVVKRLQTDNERMRAALQRIASGVYTGVIYLTYPPQDPAVNCARAALAAQPAPGKEEA